MTLAESVIAIVIVGVLMVSAMNVAGAAVMVRRMSADRAFALLLAEDLMAEITRLPYSDPDTITVALGPEAGETTRAHYDDVDDYHGFSETGPRTRDGVLLAGNDWNRSVHVAYVSPAGAFPEVANDTGVKRIVVTVSLRDTPVVVLSSLRTQALSTASSRGFLAEFVDATGDLATGLLGVTVGILKWLLG